APRSAAQRCRPLIRGRGHRSAVSLPKSGSWVASAGLGGFTGRWGCGLVFLPGKQEQQTNAGADCAVGDVESREPYFPAAPAVQIKVNEIHHVPMNEPVQQVSGDPAEDQPERKLTQQGM